MNKITEYRKGNIFLVVEDEGNDSFFRQIEEGARKRTPLASGVVTQSAIDSMVERFDGKEL